MANKRQQIVDAIQARMKTISKANSYSADIKTVDVWNLRALEDNSLPAIQIRDITDQLPADGIGGGRRDHVLNVIIGVQFSGDTSDIQARELLGDVLTAIGEDETFSDLAYRTEPSVADLIPDEANKRICFGQIVLDVYYRTGLWEL